MSTIAADFFKHRLLLSSSSPSSISENDQLFAGARDTALTAASTLQSKAYVSLAKLVSECADDGWDGYQGKAISKATCDRARAFIDKLPSWMPAPDVVPESDGEIAIEWDLAPNRIFSISIGERGPLHFAGLFGHEKERHGVEAFDGEISEDILYYIDKLLRNPTARRAA